MCGRFTLRTPAPDLIEHFGLGRIPPLPPRFNVAPTQSVAILRNDDAGQLECAQLRWGLIPNWTRDLAKTPTLINARSETVHEKPSFRSAFKLRRCLILADGFYEWQRAARGKKQPFYISLADQQPFAFAGLWESWQPQQAESDHDKIESCTILTTTANELLHELHDRMPVILSPTDNPVWLDADIQNREALEHLFEPYPSSEMTTWPVSTEVNNVRHDSPTCVERQQLLF